uniref:receptor protein-tyrosine kinase n=1 Tax=Globodera rostochiensis TaxID=31243 RepID=A0A914GXM6_GLORO
MLFNTLSLLFCLPIFLHSLIEAMENETRCGTIDIRNHPKSAFQPRYQTDRWLKYKECTILEGDFTISMITQPNITDNDFPVFEKLREITGSILVFQIRGLKSLGRMFPNLRVIGGHSLIMNYALVIYQNSDLMDIGLTKLTAIKNGGIRITENPRLCFAHDIDWNSILVGTIKDRIIDEVAICKNECPGMEDQSHCSVSSETGRMACWNSTQCQKICLHSAKTDAGCTERDELCHGECIGGCTKSNDNGACNSCRNLELNGKCVPKCSSDLYEQFGRKCLTKAECIGLPAVPSSGGNDEKAEWKAFHRQCSYECPTGFQEDPLNPHSCVKCLGYCPKKCPGDTVDSISAAMKFSKCNLIEGNLEIEMRIGVELVTADKFTEAFGEIEEITGYLVIRFSTPFMSFHMFRKLRRIHGQQLYKNTYALVVFENQNLHELFNIEKQNIEILRGKVQFLNNRMLCYKKIVTLIEHLGFNVTDQSVMDDISPVSNGDKAICDEIPLEVKIVSVYSYGFVVSWIPFNTTDLDHRKFLGYQIFYKKVEKEDPEMNINDDRSACSDSWMMLFVTDESEYGYGHAFGDESNANVQNAAKGELLNQGVEANTLYGVYVQTKLVNHPGARNAISKILFVKTLFAPPDPPRMKISEALSSSSIKLNWDPPLEPFGDITHYMISWNLVIDYDTAKATVVCDKRALLSNMPVKVSPSFASQDTCSKEGCCKCTAESRASEGNVRGKSIDANKLHDERKEKSNFEDQLQNVVFVQKTINSDGPHVVRIRRAIGFNETQRTVSTGPFLSYYNKTELNVTAFNSNILNYTMGKVNVTGTTFVLSGLPHFSEYHITVHACQNISVPDNYCSNRPAWTSARTLPIPEYDVVDPDTIVVLNSTEEKPNERRIYWKPPRTPNGFILAYWAKLTRDEESLPVDRCVPYEEFEKNETGVVFPGLSDGRYTLEIRVESSSLIYNKHVTIKEGIFVIYTPGFFTLKSIAIIAAVSLLVLLVTGVFLYHFANRMFGKKVEEYWRQTISANPEYLSQMELYKADEWELKRDDIALEEEIGRGTFGKVFRGYGRSVHSLNGETFGDCAVKTVPETASNAERLHFLIEASVMKQFSTSFIVKLYGVVSDGQPVLVVMELMAKGNLRDFLRSHRPSSEENKENRPLPTAEQFCHRDLAARNCMVHANESVKIGDFGMARDIYYQEYYKPSGKRLMPVRWMAPESLKDGKFTLKSDVWSYGIVLYEMLTLGQQPYAGLGNDQVFNYTGVQRHVLNRPTGCPDFWYGLMLFCWKYDPRERPAFRQIVRYLNHFNFIAEEFKQISFVLNDKPNDMEEFYHFDINLEDEIMQRNVMNEEFVYGMDEELDDEDMADFVSEDGLQHKPICVNNRRSDDKDEDAEEVMKSASDAELSSK